MLIADDDIYIDHGVEGIVFYKIVLLEDGEPYPHVFDEDCWTFTNLLGQLGYGVRQSGKSSQDMMVELDKPISPEHMKQLSKRYQITEDSGARMLVP
jgi:hypothetical protein